jgi:hypothetical protein
MQYKNNFRGIYFSRHIPKYCLSALQLIAQVWAVYIIANTGGKTTNGV